MTAWENAAGGRRVPRLSAIWYGIGVLLLLAVMALSLMPVLDTGVNDKLSHLVAYCVLAGWFGLLAGSRAALLWTLAGIVAYGGLIELLQAMMPHRQAEWADLLANTVGALAGICLSYTPLRRLLLLVDRLLAGILLR